jgi:hypothetical protein
MMKALSYGKIKKHVSFVMDICAFQFFVFVITAIFFSSCTKVNEFTIGNNFIESQTNLKIVDTFKVDLSTVLLDSISTSGSGIALVGSYKNNEIGTINCSSYFDVEFSAFDAIDKAAVFDSADFMLRYSRYSFGDTTSLMSVSIHELTEKITLNTNGYLYNTSKFKFSPVSLGTKLFYPRPTDSSDSVVYIPVNSYGETLFNLIKSGDVLTTQRDLFLDYMKGFVLTTDAGEKNAVIGFKADATNLLFRIYYHIEKETHEEKQLTITMGTSGNQFNSIQHDFTGTDLNNLTPDNNEISSTLTKNKAFLLGFVGLMPKINFPTLQNVMLENRWKILKAELVIEPVKSSYDFFALPKDLNLYETDKHNKNNGTLLNESGNTLVASFVLDNLYRDETSYTFDITNFISTELSDKYFDPEHGLLIGLSESVYKSTLGRLVVEGRNPPIKLKLYYLTY